jgi:ATP diphosphatase
MTPSRDISRLIEIMAALRTPVTGCPWDIEQTFETIAPYTIEEAYEVADAIQRGDLSDLKDELGDLLLQVVYHARMAEEAKAFAFPDVVEAVTTKMIRRHPHVFGDADARAAGAAKGQWDKIKAEEKEAKTAARASAVSSPLVGEDQGGGDSRTVGAGAPPTPSPSPRRVEDSPSARGGGEHSLLSDVPVTLPALTRAIKLQSKAAKVGFDWPSLAPVFEKLEEEIRELEEVALPADPRGDARDTSPETRAKVEEEFGDLLFVMANVARHLDIDPEAALRGANQKFVRRFQYIEQSLAAAGKSPEQSSLAEMDDLWDEAKANERK